MKSIILILCMSLAGATAFAANEGPSGSPQQKPVAAPSPSGAPVSLSRQVTPGMIANGRTNNCEISGSQVKVVISSGGDEKPYITFASVIYDESVPNYEAEQTLVGQAYQGKIAQQPGHPDAGTTSFYAQIGQSPPSVPLLVNGATNISNSSSAATTLVAFIARNCDQITTVGERNPIARLEITAPIPKFVPELFEIDADGSAVLIQGGATQVLAHFSPDMIAQLQAVSNSLKAGPLVDPSPGLPNCLGGKSHSYYAYQADGSSVEFAAYQMCHNLSLAGNPGAQIREMLDGLMGLVDAANGAPTTLVGIWGATGAKLTVGSSSVHIDSGCGAADISGVVSFDAQGNFTAQGTYTFEGGAFPVGGYHAQPAVFYGHLQGDELDISIQIGPDEHMGTYQFHYGQIAMFARCE